MSLAAMESTARAGLDARAVWTGNRLRALVAEVCGGESLVVLANREPLRHDYRAGGRITSTKSAGGLVTALEPLIEACSGVWVAHGSGTADRAVVDDRDRVNVPTDAPLYRLRRVWLDSREERGYYRGFANEGLWPLCHRVHVQPTFRSNDFRHYRAANERFAKAVCDEVDGNAPVVLVQDYHFALAPSLIRQRLPDATIVAFWHIPFPDARTFAICPWGLQLLEGLLGSTVVGFQTAEDCRNFAHTVAEISGARIDTARSAITYRGRQTTIRAYPVSVEWPNRWAVESPSIPACRAAVRSRLGLRDDVRLVVGVDRLDYTKGIDEKCLAVERLLARHPRFRDRLVFVQIAEPSRESLEAYRALASRVAATIARINTRFGTADHQPILLLNRRHEPDEVHEFLCAADICYVGSLHDGMNLVAKEFVSARADGRGVLILSRFAGAAQELRDAIVVNPYDVDGCADALAVGLTMSSGEQEQRMRAMQSVVARFNTYRWAAEILSDAARLRNRALAS